MNSGGAYSARTAIAVNPQALTFEEFRERTHFQALDGLRALSALLVITVHMKIVDWSALHGARGVLIFFVLSGFLITTLALREEAARGCLSLKAFYVRRVFRIFPIYYVVLLVYCVLVLLLNIGSRRAFLDALPFFLTYSNEFAPAGRVPFAQSWSLGIEEKFYLIWPAVGFLFLRQSTRGRIAFIACAIGTHYCILNRITTEIGASGSSVSDISSFYLDILLGCLVAVGLNNKRIYGCLRILGGQGAATIVAVALVFSQFLPYEDLLFPYLVVLFVISIVVGRNSFSTLLGSRPCAFVGTRSYGIYLLHVIALGIVERLLAPLDNYAFVGMLCFVAASVVSLVLSDLLYRTIEAPGIRLGRRIAQGIATQGTTVP